MALSFVFQLIFGPYRQDMAKNVETFIADILISLLDEAQSLPAELLEVILSQFMQKPSVSRTTQHSRYSSGGAN